MKADKSADSKAETTARARRAPAASAKADAVQEGDKTPAAAQQPANMSLPGDLEVAGAAEAAAGLAEWLGQISPDTCGQGDGADPPTLDITESAPTQVALQLLLLAARSLEQAGTPVRFGPNAAVLLDRAC
ncbi:hypothetical protein ATO3_17180 [Marinibacterium profundimaris]|uniref:Uncharacterized protein n=2 Tax=Marinibacterium profundimaris TaxID=1679460 RepID=A0A225NFN9_9RHOB|nr:hypothetical protein ATO3_17180 [Marinibacterium profundimaris]